MTHAQKGKDGKYDYVHSSHLDRSSISISDALPNEACCVSAASLKEKPVLQVDKHLKHLLHCTDEMDGLA